MKLTFEIEKCNEGEYIAQVVGMNICADGETVIEVMEEIFNVTLDAFVYSLFGNRY